MTVSAITVAVASGLTGYVWYENQRPPLLEIYIFTLKSGQAIFLRTPSDKRILIDGGTNSEIIRQISSILPFYTRRIDKIIVTKPDSRHVSGLIDVLGRYSVEEAILPAINLEDLSLSTTTDQVYKTFTSLIENNSVPVKKVIAGDSLVLDSGFITDKIKYSSPSGTSSVGMDILFPMSASSTFVYSRASGPELVTRISYGSTSVLLAGSVTPKIQKYIVKSSGAGMDIQNDVGDLKSDILVIYQNATSSNIPAIFMGAVKPTYIVYSKKPDPLARIPEENRFNIRDTGGVKIVSDGRDMKISRL